MDLTGQTFIRGTEIENGRFIINTQDPGLDIETQPHTGLCYWTKEEGWVEIGLAPKLTVDATPNEDGSMMIKIDPTGFIHELDGDDVEKEFLKDAEGKIPSSPFRCIRRIGSQIFACGVEQQVQRRDDGPWEIISPKDKTDSPSSFECIDGFGPTEVYAAGWDGEIWAFDGSSWTKRNSPTSVVLNDICAGAETCVAVGLAGVIVMGRGDEWQEIEQDETDDAFWSVREFNGAFYMAALNAIYKLEDGKVTLFRDIDEDMRTTFMLSVGPSGLWSVGASDITLFDGTDWHTIAQA